MAKTLTELTHVAIEAHRILHDGATGAVISYGCGEEDGFEANVGHHSGRGASPEAALQEVIGSIRITASKQLEVRRARLKAAEELVRKLETLG